MSYTISTSEMVAELQRRVPVGLSPVFCMDRLNEAYRWICQRGPMNWLLTRALVLTTTGGGEVGFVMPSDWDSGKPAYLSGDLSIGYGVEIPYKPYDLAIRNQTYGALSAGQYAVWTYRHMGLPVTAPSLATGAASTAPVANGTYRAKIVNTAYTTLGTLKTAPSAAATIVISGNQKITVTFAAGPLGTTGREIWMTMPSWPALAPGTVYYKVAFINDNTTLTYSFDMTEVSAVSAFAETIPTVSMWSYDGILFPYSAAGVHTLALIYHSTPGAPLAVGPYYFPSPDVFDSCLIELAESEIRRVYSLSGWEIVKARTQEQVMSIIDGYHTTKQTMAGLADEARQLQEVQAEKAK